MERLPVWAWALRSEGPPPGAPRVWDHVYKSCIFLFRQASGGSTMSVLCQFPSLGSRERSEEWKPLPHLGKTLRWAITVFLWKVDHSWDYPAALCSAERSSHLCPVLLHRNWSYLVATGSEFQSLQLSPGWPGLGARPWVKDIQRWSCKGNKQPRGVEKLDPTSLPD